MTPTASLKKSLPNGLTVNSNGLTKAHTINLSSDGISPALLTATQHAAAGMPLNLNINAIQHHQLTNGGTNGIKTTSNGLQIITSNSAPATMPNVKNGIRHHTIDFSERQQHNQHTTTIMTNGKNSKEQATKIDTISASEPPTKVIKLINGNGITLVDKDSKLIPSGQLQVVVSQIPLLTPTQTLRVIGPASNGVATIELSNSNGMNG